MSDKTLSNLATLLPDATRPASSPPQGGKAITMKQVTAVIKPFALDKVREALTALGVQGMTVTEVKEFSRCRGYTFSLAPHAKIEIVVREEMVERIIDVLRNSSRVAPVVGGGAVVVIPVSRTIRIRTGEVDADAL